MANVLLFNQLAEIHLLDAFMAKDGHLHSCAATSDCPCGMILRDPADFFFKALSQPVRVSEEEKIDHFNVLARPHKLRMSPASRHLHSCIYADDIVKVPTIREEKTRDATKMGCLCLLFLKYSESVFLVPEKKRFRLASRNVILAHKQTWQALLNNSELLTESDFQVQRFRTLATLLNKRCKMVRHVDGIISVTEWHLDTCVWKNEDVAYGPDTCECTSHLHHPETYFIDYATGVIRGESHHKKSCRRVLFIRALSANQKLSDADWIEKLGCDCLNEQKCTKKDYVTLDARENATVDGPPDRKRKICVLPDDGKRHFVNGGFLTVVI